MQKNYSRRVLTASIISASILSLTSAARAADGIKADNFDDLNLPSSWIGESQPDFSGIALFGSSIISAYTFGLSESVFWGGISVTNPSLPLTITGTPGAILSLGTTGISMASATVDFSIDADLFLAATQTWTINNNRTLTINGTIDGDPSTTLTKAGAGVLLLSGANNFQGKVNVTQGNLTLGASNALPSTTVVTIGGTGTSQLVLNGFEQTLSGLATATGGTRRVIGNSAFSTSILTLNVAAGQTYRFEGQVGNGANANPNNISIIKEGAGIQELTNANNLTYTGTTTIRDGALAFTIPNGPASSHLILDGGVIQIQGGTAHTFTRSIGDNGLGSEILWTENGGGFSARDAKLTVNIGGAFSPVDWGTAVGAELVGTFKFGSTNANAEVEFQNPINLNGAIRTIEVANNANTAADFATISGSISDGIDAGGIIKTGSGLLALSGLNTYSGPTTISAGTLSVASPSSLPGYAMPGKITVEPGATLQVRIGSLNEWTPVELDSLIQSADFQPTSSLGLETPSFVTLDTSITAPDLKLTKAGAGTLVLSGNNTYGGGTQLLGGLVKVGNSSSIGTGPITIAGGGISSVDGTPVTFANNLSFQGPSTLGDPVTDGTLTFQGNIDFGGVVRFVTTNSDVVFDGPSSNGGVGQKLGPGTLTISGNADWSGGGLTEIREGTLIFDADVVNFDAVRVMATKPGSTARLEIKPGATLSILAPTANLRVGYSPGGDNTATNIADIWGTVQFPAFGTGGAVQLGTSSSKAILNLHPGSLIATRGVTFGPTPRGETEANFDGGTLRAILSGSNLVQNLTHAYLKEGGLIVDTNGFDVTLSQPLEHHPDLVDEADGGFTKIGAGSVTLSGASNFNGPVTVEEGTLILAAGSLVGSVEVQSGASLEGWGPIYLGSNGDVTVKAGGVLSPGVGVGPLEISAFGGQVNLADALGGSASGSLVFELSYGYGDSISLTGGSFNIGEGLLGFDDFVFHDFGIPGIGTTYTLLDSDSPVIGYLDPSNRTGFIGIFQAEIAIGDNGNDVLLHIVPEPSTALLSLVSTATLLGLRRHRRRISQ